MAKKLKIRNGTVNEITIDVPYTIPAQEVMVSITVPLKDVEKIIKEHKKK